MISLSFAADSWDEVIRFGPMAATPVPDNHNPVVSCISQSHPTIAYHGVTLLITQCNCCIRFWPWKHPCLHGSIGKIISKKQPQIVKCRLASKHQGGMLGRSMWKRGSMLCGAELAIRTLVWHERFARSMYEKLEKYSSQVVAFEGIGSF